MNYLCITSENDIDGQREKHIFYQPELNFVDYDSLSNDDIKNYLLTHEYTQNYYRRYGLSLNDCLDDVNFWELPIMTNVVRTDTDGWRYDSNASYTLKFRHHWYYIQTIFAEATTAQPIPKLDSDGPGFHVAEFELVYTRAGPWRFQIDLCELKKFWNYKEFLEALYFPGELPEKIILEYPDTQNIEIPVTNKYMAMGLVNKGAYSFPTAIRVKPLVDAKIIVLYLDVPAYLSPYNTKINNTLEWKCVEGMTIPLKK